MAVNPKRKRTLNELIAERGLHPRDIMHAVHCSATSLAAWRRGAIPNGPRMIRLCAALGVLVEDVDWGEK